MTDDDYLLALGIDYIDAYDFSERVSAILEHLPTPTQREVDDARERALKELTA